MEALSELGVLVFKLAMGAGVGRSSSTYLSLFIQILFGIHLFSHFGDVGKSFVRHSIPNRYILKWFCLLLLGFSDPEIIFCTFLFTFEGRL